MRKATIAGEVQVEAEAGRVAKKAVCRGVSTPCVTGLFCDDQQICRPGGILASGAPCGLVGGHFVNADCVAGITCGSLEFPNGGGGYGTTTTCNRGPPNPIFRRTKVIVVR